WVAARFPADRPERVYFFFQAEDGIRDFHVTGVQTCALPICYMWKRMKKETISSWYRLLLKISVTCNVFWKKKVLKFLLLKQNVSPYRTQPCLKNKLLTS